MKKLVYSASKESVSAYCHFIVTEPMEGVEKGKILAAGLIDVDSSSRATAAHLVRGNKKMILTFDDKTWVGESVFAEKGGVYRFWQSSIGKRNSSARKGQETFTTHCVVLHKRITDSKEEREWQEIHGGRVVLVPDGQVVNTVGRMLVEEFALPNLSSWFQPLYDYFVQQKWLVPLDVWKDEQVKTWARLQAFSLSEKLTEQAVLDAVSKGIREGWLEIPEGVTEAPAVTEDMNDITQYLMTFAPHLATQVEEEVQPLHDLDRPLEKGMALMKRVPFPAQAHTIQALVNAYDKGGKKAAISSSDMGCGKSIQALGVANVLWHRAKTSGRKGFVCFILAPGVTIPKWIHDEIQATLPEAKITWLKNWKDTVAWIDRVRKNGYKKTDGLEFVLMGKDASKLGLKRLPSLNWKRIVLPDEQGQPQPTNQYGWHCPHCGQPIHTIQDEEDDKTIDKVANWETFAQGEPPAHAVLFNRIPWKEIRKELHCPACHEKLTRFADPKRGEMGHMKNRRMEPAMLIKRYLKGYIDLLVVDELQQYKNQSGQGMAMATLVSSSKRVLGLTGTLSDGKASSLFYLLSRCDYRRLQMDGFHHNSLNRFIRRYGVTETHVRYESVEEVKGGVTRGRIVSKVEKEIPGLSPRLFVNHLADKATFLELGDLGLPLVKIEEHPIFIQMDEEHQREYKQFHSWLDNVCRAAMASGSKNAYAKFIPSVVNYANLPFQDFRVQVGDEIAYAPALYGEEEYTAKERQLVHDVQEEVRQGRRCIVYVTYTGTYQQDRRLAKVLQDHGIRAKVMKASVDADERIEWMQKAAQEGVQCVVLNVSLVEVGVDLIDWPTLIFYEMTDKVNTMRQAARRAWRIGQYRNCRVLYYVYEESYEVVQFRRMMAKRAHALLLEGRLERSEMAQYIEQDQYSAATVSIAECLGNVSDLTQKWTDLADKDIPAGVTMLDEAEYKAEIRRAMMRLANETRRLCGVPALVVDHTQTVNDKEVPVVSVETNDSWDLFAFASMNAENPLSSGETVVDHVEYDAGVRIVSESLRRQSMGLVTKAKRKKKKVSGSSFVEDGQLGFLF